MSRLKLFGGAVVDAEGEPITGRAAQRHRIALLALLATTRRLYRSRDQLTALLWPEADSERGRKLLSDSIYRINQALGADAITGTGEDVRLDRDQVSSDVADLESALDARDWSQVADLYTGPFLDGFFLPNANEFDQWMEAERAHYARAAAKAIEALAVQARESGRLAEAVELWQRVAALGPDDSRVAMELMRALEASGNRAGALRHARVHASLLQETLGVEPDRAVQDLADQIARRTDAVIYPRAVAAASGDAGAVTSPAARGSAASPASEPPNDPWTRSATTRKPRARWAMLAGVVAVISAVVVLQLRPGQNVNEPATRPALGSAIAVLPFHNVSESDTNAYFADGMSEELMYLLARTPGLHVASRTSSFAYRDLKLDVREVARRLRVDWILEGSVRRSGNKLRIVAQLTDARNGYQVWTQSFDRTANDIFAIQEEIAGAIASQLSSIVGEPVGTVPTLGAKAALDPATYDVYLQARFEWHRRTEESLKRSAKLFEDVVARDKDYARAWTGLADAYAVLAFYDYMPPRLAYPRADSAALTAIRLDSTLAAPYATLAYVNTYYHWNWEAAERGFLRAIELEPSYSTAHQWYSNLLTARGRFDEAEREMRRAAELDPLSLIAHSALGWVFVLANQNDRAINQLKSALQLDSNFQLAHYWMGLALDQQGRLQEAIPVFRHALTLSRDNALVLASLAHAYAAAGQPDSARAILGGLLSREKAGAYVSSYELAKVYQALGDTARALARLEQAYDDRSHSMAFLNVDPQLRPLASAPRFRQLAGLVDDPAARR